MSDLEKGATAREEQAQNGPRAVYDNSSNDRVPFGLTWAHGQEPGLIDVRSAGVVYDKSGNDRAPGGK